MSKTRRSRRSSAGKSWSARSPLYRRIVYFVVMVMTGGSAGVGGWLCKDYPQLQPIISMIFGPAEEGGIRGDLRRLGKGRGTAEGGTIAAREDRPGVYRVRIDRVQLDAKSFTPGRTVDVQARVRKIDADEAETDVWESRSYGENLAVVGRDELSASWSNRPFEVEWRRGDRFMIEVYDGRAGLFSSSQTFRMARRDGDGFPLASGEFQLEPEGRIRPGTNPAHNRVTLASERSGDSAAGPAGQSPRDAPPRAPARRGPDLPASVAERPILIR